MNYSLRKRLIIWISIPIGIVILFSLILGYKTIKKEINEIYDANLINSAKDLTRLIRSGRAENNPKILLNPIFNKSRKNQDFHHRYQNNIEFRIWQNDKIILSSIEIESKQFKRNKFKKNRSHNFFFTKKIDNQTWRFFVLNSPKNDFQIEVFESYDARSEIIFGLLMLLLLPAVLLIVIIFLIIWFGIQKILAPVINLSQDFDTRNSDDLSAIKPNDLPKEIIPMISALNRLFKRLQKSIRLEKEFTDYAAHELRTPLAAMKTQTQVLLRDKNLTNENIDGLNNLESSINRTIHLVDQLLTLSRLQNQKVNINTLNLSDLLTEVIENLKLEIDKKNLNLETAVSENIVIKGNYDSLVSLFSNLLINSIKYTQSGGLISVSLNQSGVVKIKDTGSGLSDKDKKEVFKRFVRKDKTNQTGSGLGLCIAKWIADSHNLKIKLKDNKPNGLIVEIS